MGPLGRRQIALFGGRHWSSSFVIKTSVLYNGKCELSSELYYEAFTAIG
jgi:hypothetical protein